MTVTDTMRGHTIPSMDETRRAPQAPDDDTALLADETTIQQAEALAWSDTAAGPTEAGPYAARLSAARWIVALGALALALSAVVVGALVLAGDRSEPIPAAPAPTTAPEPASTDDQWVAVALSPTLPEKGGGFGMSDTEDRARVIALSECHNATGGGDCLVAETALHGCVSYALSPDRRTWAGARGPNADAARANAIAKLPAGAWAPPGYCSDPESGDTK